MAEPTIFEGTTGELVSGVTGHLVDAVMARIHLSTVPLFDGGGIVPEFVGSATLVRWGSRYLLVTAGHVARVIDRARTLLIAAAIGQGGLLPLHTPVCTFLGFDAGTLNDLGWIELDGQTASTIEGLGRLFISEDRVGFVGASTLGCDHGLVFVVGYPAKLVALQHGNSFVISALRIFGPPVHQPPGLVSRQSDMVYSQRVPDGGDLATVVTDLKTGARVDCPDSATSVPESVPVLSGLSGGGVWHVRALGGDGPKHQLRLVGVHSASHTDAVTSVRSSLEVLFWAECRLPQRRPPASMS